MLASDVSNVDVSLAVHRDEATGMVLIGAVIGDVFVPFFTTKLSLFDELHAQGVAQKSAQAAAAAAADEPQAPTQ